MPDNTVNIRIGTDLSELEADSKKLGSALEGAAQGGIGGFEQVRSRLVAATQQVVQLRKELQTATDPAVVARLNTALGTAQQQMSLARVEMRGISTGARQATESANMLAAQLGINLPAGIERVIARMPGVQAAMGVAFGATIVVAFGAAIVTLFPKIAEWIDMLRGVEAVNQDILNKEMELDRYLVAGGKPERTSAMTTEFEHVAGRIDEIKRKLIELQGAPWSLGRLEFGLRAATDLGLTMDRVKALRIELEPLQTRFEELKRAVPTEQLKEFNKTAAEGAERSAKALLFQVETIREDYARLLDLQEKAVEAEKAADQMIIASRHEMVLQLNKDMDDQVRMMEEHGRVMDERIIRQSKEAQDAAKEAAHAQEQMLEATAGKIESFIDRVFLTARSLSDVFHQFLMQTLGSFVKWISHMLAEWWTGVKRATAGAGGGVTGGGGGWLGSLLGGVFGIGGGAPALAASGGVTAEAGQLGLPLGMGGMGLVGGGGIPSAVGGAAQGGLGYAAFHPGQLLGNLATLGPAMAIMGGISLAGGGGPVRGALGGALVGGGIGLGLYSLGLLGGPWGLVFAGIGAAIGGLVGLFRRGRQKQKSAALEQQFEFAGNDILKQYELHKVDYESAISSLEGLIASGQETLLAAGTGRWGRQGAENLTRVIQELIARVNDLEKQRQATTTTLAGMTIPEFAIGGSVPGLGTRGSGLGGGILAILHPGEFVMRESAVDALGVNFLAALNRPPSFAAGGAVSPSRVVPHGGIHIHGNLILYPAQDMSEHDAMNMVVRGFNRAVRDGAL
jgi:hypothetical protein